MANKRWFYGFLTGMLTLLAPLVVIVVLFPFPSPPERLLRGDCVEIQKGMDEGLTGTVIDVSEVTGIMVKVQDGSGSFNFYKDRGYIRRAPLSRCYNIKQ